MKKSDEGLALTWDDFHIADEEVDEMENAMAPDPDVEPENPDQPHPYKQEHADIYSSTGISWPPTDDVFMTYLRDTYHHCLRRRELEVLYYAMTYFKMPPQKDIEYIDVSKTLQTLLGRTGTSNPWAAFPPMNATGLLFARIRSRDKIELQYVTGSMRMQMLGLDASEMADPVNTLSPSILCAASSTVLSAFTLASIMCATIPMMGTTLEDFHH